MHMIRRKDWTSAELETVTTSRCPTTVITANGEVQTHEEATCLRQRMGKFLTVKIVQDTPAVFSPGKLCEDHGHSYAATNGQQPCLIKTVFIYSVIRKTTYRSWSRVYRRLLPRQARLVQHLQHHYRRTTKHGATRRLTQQKTQNPIETWTVNKFGATRHFQKYLNCCKKSGIILWMKDFLSTETHT